MEGGVDSVSFCRQVLLQTSEAPPLGESQTRLQAGGAASPSASLFAANRNNLGITSQADAPPREKGGVGLHL